MPGNLYELRISIRDDCKSVDMQILSTVCDETDHRFDMRGIANGAHNEISHSTPSWRGT